MAHHGNATRATTTGGTSLVSTVPTGVTDAMFGLVLVTGATNTTNETPVTLTVVSNAPGETVTTLEAPDSDNNMWEATYKITGVEAGETITTTITVGGARAFEVDVLFFTADFDAIGGITFKGGVSSSSVAAPAIACTVGQRIYAVMRERSPSAVDTYTGVNSRGLTLTERYDADQSASPNCGVYVAEFIADATTSGITTVSEDNAANTTGNGSAFHIAEHVSLLTLTIDDNMGLDDTVAEYVINVVETIEDFMNMTDSIFIEMIVPPDLIIASDTMGLTDPITIDLTVSPDVLVFNDTMQLEDEIVIDLTVEGTPPVEYEGSLSDQIMQWFTARGYNTGSIADRTYRFLLDEYIAEFGTPERPMSASDMAKALGKTLHVRIVTSEWE